MTHANEAPDEGPAGDLSNVIFTQILAPSKMDSNPEQFASDLNSFWMHACCAPLVHSGWDSNFPHKSLLPVKDSFQDRAANL